MSIYEINSHYDLFLRVIAYYKQALIKKSEAIKVTLPYTFRGTRNFEAYP